MADRSAFLTRAEDWVRAQPRGRLLGLTFAMGALTGTGQAPLGLVINAMIGLFAGYLLYRAAANWRAAAVTGLAFGTGYFALTLAWIVEPFFVNPSRHGWMAPFGILFLSAGLALFWGAAFAGAKRMAPSPLAGAVAWVGAMGLAELARAYVLTGFPWGLVGYVWSDNAGFGWLRLIGPHGLTLLTLATAPLSFALLAGRRAPIFLALALFPGVAISASGALLLPKPAAPGPERPVIRLIQPNAAQHLKWDPEMIPVFFRRQISFSAADAPRRPDLIVWPETAIPSLLEQSETVFAAIADAAGETPVVLGLQRTEGLRYFNSLALLRGGEVQAIYDKHHLVPFGEYMPLDALWSALGISGLAASQGGSFSAGPGPVLLDLGPLGRALPLICYEAVFPQLTRGVPARPDLLLQITNDAWFGNWSGPFQHFAQARARALEQGLPMIRVANTGISAVIGPDGRPLGELALGTAGYVDLPLPAPLPLTPYGRTGDWPVLIVLFMLAAASLSIQRRNSD